MKTRIIIILALISLNINLVSARTNSSKGVDGPVKSAFSVSLSSLIPVIFEEATFEDAMDVNSTASSFSSLAPVTPEEATFEDAMDVNFVVPSLSSLAPVTPKEASFEDIISGEETTITVSSPVNQKSETIEKGKTVHPAFPVPCDAKYGCSL